MAFVDDSNTSDQADTPAATIAPLLPDPGNEDVQGELSTAAIEDVLDTTEEQTAVSDDLAQLEDLEEVDSESETEPPSASEPSEAEALPGFLNDLSLPLEDVSLDLDLLEASTESTNPVVGGLIPDDPDSGSEDYDEIPDNPDNTPEVPEAPTAKAPLLDEPEESPMITDASETEVSDLGVISEDQNEEPLVIADAADIASEASAETETFSLEVDLNLSLDSVPGEAIVSENFVADITDSVELDDDAGVAEAELEIPPAVETETDSDDDGDLTVPGPIWAIEGSVTEGYRLSTDEAVLNEFIETTLADLPGPDAAMETTAPRPSLDETEVRQSFPQSAFELTGSNDEGFSLVADPTASNRQLDVALAEIPTASEDGSWDRRSIEMSSPSPKSASAVDLEPISGEEMAELFPFLARSTRSSVDTDSDSDLTMDPTNQDRADQESSAVPSLGSQAILDILEDTKPEINTPISTLYREGEELEIGPVDEALASLAEESVLDNDSDVAVPSAAGAEAANSSDEEAGPLSDDELAQLFPPTVFAEDATAATASAAFLAEEPLPEQAALDLDRLDDVADRLDDLTSVSAIASEEADDATSTDVANTVDSPDIDSTMTEVIVPDISLDDVDVDTAELENVAEEVDVSLDEAAIADFTFEDIEIPPGEEEEAANLLAAAGLDELFPPVSEVSEGEESEAAIVELFPTVPQVSESEDDRNASDLVDSTVDNEAENSSLDTTEAPEADASGFADVFDNVLPEEFPGVAADDDLDIAADDVSIDDLGLSAEESILLEGATAADASIDDFDDFGLSTEEVMPLEAAMTSPETPAHTSDTDAVTKAERDPIPEPEVDPEAAAAEPLAFADFDLSMEEVSEAEIENDEVFRSAFQDSDLSDLLEVTEAPTDVTSLEVPEVPAPDLLGVSETLATDDLVTEAPADVTSLEVPEVPAPDLLGVSETPAVDDLTEASETAEVVEQVDLPSLNALFEDEDEATLEAAFAEVSSETDTDESLDEVFDNSILSMETEDVVSQVPDDADLLGEETPAAESTASSAPILDAESLEAAFAEDTSETSDDLGLDRIFGEDLPEAEAEVEAMPPSDQLASEAETLEAPILNEDVSGNLDDENREDALGETVPAAIYEEETAPTQALLDEESLEAAFSEASSDTLDAESLNDIFGATVPTAEPEEEAAPTEISLNSDNLEAAFSETSSDALDAESLNDIFGATVPTAETEPEITSVSDDLVVADREVEATMILEESVAPMGEEPVIEEVPSLAEDVETLEVAVEEEVPTVVPEAPADTEPEIMVDAIASEASPPLIDLEDPEVIVAREEALTEAPVAPPEFEEALEAVEFNEAPSTSALLAMLPSDEPTGEEPESPPIAAPVQDEWFLGIDFGTGGLSAVLMNRMNGAAHPLYWSYRGSNASGENTFRLPTVAALRVNPEAGGSEAELHAIGVTALIEGAKDTHLQLLNALKPLLKVGIPHQVETQQWEPVIQWSDDQTVSLQKVFAGVQALLALVRQLAGTPLELGAVGLGHRQVKQILDDLQGIVMGHPSSWSDTYCINLREAVLAARLVEDPSQIFFVEEAIAAILSGLPDPNDLPLPQGRQTQTLYQCNWQGGTVVISAGISCTELGLVDLPHPLDTVSREDFVLRSLAYGGDALDLDIICQLLFPSERRTERSNGDRRPTSTGGWQPRFPETETAQWDSLELDSLELPQLAEPDFTKRIRLRQHLEASKLGQSLLEAARHLKLILQNQSQFQLELADQSWRVLRRDLEGRVLVPYIQRLNQQLNALLSQTGLASQGINQVICTGGNVSFSTIAKWLRQKFPNATIIQDTYPINRSPSCSRVAYGLVNLCRYPQILDVPRHQYSDYFLLHEVIRAVPDQPLPLDGILHLLEEQGLNTDACRSRILALLEGHLPPGLVPGAPTNPYLSETTLTQAIYQNLMAAPLFTRQSEDIYMLNTQQRDRIRTHLDTLLANKRQSLAEPLIAQLVIP